MSRGTRYPFVEAILREQAGGAETVLEIGAGGAIYRDLFKRHVATDLPGNPYEERGDIAVHCDGQRLPFAEGSFDAAFVVAALYQIHDAAAVMDEVRRALKPGGVFLIFDYNKKRTKRLRDSERAGSNENHVWSARELVSMARSRGFKAAVVNHHGREPGGALAKKVKRSGIYRILKSAAGEDWIVVRAER